MIILAIFNFLVGLEYNLVNLFFNSAIPTLNSLTTWITNVSIPQTVLNILAISTYFLPMATITVLFGLTSIIVFIKAAGGFLHVLALGKIF